MLRVISVTVLSTLLGCAASSNAQKKRIGRRFERAVALLEARPDADSLAAAGLLNLPKHREKSLSLLIRASTVAPDRPDLIWLTVVACQSTTGCDALPFEERLRTLDPANGAGWLGSLARADSRNDEDAKLTAMTAISRSERVDVYWTTLAWRLSKATTASRFVPLTDAVVAILGVIAAEVIPSYKFVSQACKGQRLQRDDIVEACRGVADAFRHGDTDATEMIGNAIAQRVWPKDSPQWQEAAEARRTWDYRSNALIQARAWNAVGVIEYLALLHGVIAPPRRSRQRRIVFAQYESQGQDLCS